MVYIKLKLPTRVKGDVQENKGANINMSRADNTHAVSRLEHNLRFTENKTRLKCLHLSYFHKKNLSQL